MGSTKFDQPATLRRLAEQYVVDLPLAAADLVALAAIDDWQQGPAQIALARSEWRRHHNRDWADTWLQIATHARRFSADALVDTTKAALTGSIEHISSGRRTQRYQQLVVLALLGATTPDSSPPDLLDELARHAGPALPPRPPFVLAALINELTRRLVHDADLLDQACFRASIFLRDSCGSLAVC